MKTIVIPDTRFQQVFQNALERERNKLYPDTTKQNTGTLVTESLVIFKVILRDVILLPFIQSVLWTEFLIVCKPRIYRGFKSIANFNIKNITNMLTGRTNNY
ncbi:uncharacterized protein NDAI_0G01990 [Naumovozyma dairenensis CBS 421]|uniref:Uncharacterized protein n=1 Tax=Naumovozyma dairenensis (strain ATCC 10597 / BCRC 20456 / CBS 421 / NBRC 0211 / NRRL Y-12639) TaxID=1071378 RepID=G0WDW3_NAUDC|nr:hypothetical protein NDAI_0G01990 [Naumovozyma dairenensis CBS 421]CCD25974.2 hypothetical protein NDAI_0G01990 [Naumovozyma dairenensis CBS 421]